MTEEEFLKKRFKPFERIEFQEEEFLLIAVDFDQRLFKLRQFPSTYSDIYDDKDFWVRCDYCRRPYPKLKVIN